MSGAVLRGVNQATLIRDRFREFSFEVFRNYQVVKYGLKSYVPTHRIHFETADFRIQTAESPEHVIQSLRLRHQVFFPSRREDKLDVDDLDLLADHLLIYEKAHGRLIGSYRLLTSEMTPRFYSETEFDLTRLKKSGARFLEMGRACIHPDFRNGASIHLLWKGLGQYLTVSKPEILFGSASIFDLSPEYLNSVHKYLFENYRSEKFQCDAHSNWQLRLPKLDSGDANSHLELPALLRTYLLAGAQVTGLPAWDPDFQCVDYLIVLEMCKMNPRFIQKYLKQPLPHASASNF